MEAWQERTLSAGKRVQPFLNVHADSLSGLPLTSLRAKLDGAVAELGSFQLEQSNAEDTARGEANNQARLKEDLYDRFVGSNVRVAQLLLADTAEFPALTVPRSVLLDRDFVPVIEKFRLAATTHEAVLVEHGMPSDFLPQLDTAIAAVSASIAMRSRQLARQKAATEGCRASAKALRSYIGIIDGVLRPVLKKNPSLARDWVATKRVPQVATTPLPNGSLETADGASADGEANTSDTNAPAAAEAGPQA